MAQWFENLMDGVERNLLCRNRDRFEIFLELIFKLATAANTIHY